MQVTAISTPPCRDWCWRIIGYNGEVVEESSERFPSMAAALSEGKERLGRLNGSERRRGERPTLPTEP